MKYYIANITDDYRCLEFSTSILVTANDKTIDNRLEHICSTWYGEENSIDDDDGFYEQPNGCITHVDGVREITEATFNELKPFLGTL